MQWKLPALAAALLSCPAWVQAAYKNWPSYNNTLTSERYATLDAVDSKNAAGLKVLCSFDTGEQTSFQTGLVEVDGALFATTEHDTFSIDANTCKQNWRTHEEFASGALKVSRGLAWLEGRIYALDAKTGQIVWEFYMVPKGPEDAARGPAAPSAGSHAATSWKNAKGTPITGGATWTSYSLDPSKGLLYVPGGNPAPDFAKAPRPGENLFTGSIVVLDAKTGAYQRHFQLVTRDFHDWDVSGAPVLFLSNAGHRMLAEAPKDGHLYLIDLSNGRTVYRKPVTTVSNVDAPLTAQGTRFCPGSQGGAEWNGAAFDPADNLIFTGEVDWCTTVQSVPVAALVSAPLGQPWSGATTGFGRQDDPKHWGGWMTATDAASGERKWQFHAPFPIMGGVTPTSGGLLLFGDMGGHFYVFNSASGKKLWSTDLGGAIGGGVITYDAGQGQKIDVAAGMTSPIWPTPKINGKVVLLGL